MENSCKIQLSVKDDGSVLVNIYADDEGEYALIAQNLEESDSAFSRATYEFIADGLDIKPKKKSKSKKSKDEDDEEEEEEEEEEEDDEDEKPKRRKAPKKKGKSKSKRR